MVPIFGSDTSFIAPPLGKTGWPWTLPASKHFRERRNGGRWPRITIITPSYNQAEFIEETIRSILLQGYPNLEYMIIDGGSGLSTIRVIEKYSKWLDYFVSGPDRGQSDAINRGLSRSTGDLLAWINSDDVLLPGALHAVATAAHDYDQPLVVAGQSEYRDVSGVCVLYDAFQIPRTHSDLFKFGSGCYFPQPSTFFTRTAFLQSGKLDEGLHYAMDLDLWFRLLKRSRVVLIDERISWMRQHTDAKTFRDPFCSLDEVEQIFARYKDLVPSEALFEALESMRFKRAQVCIDQGLHSLHNGDQRAAVAAALLAVRSRGRIALSRSWLSLAARIALGERIWSRVRAAYRYL
jgi:glycosyltransferase involved in cell wall biosynthesis